MRKGWIAGLAAAFVLLTVPGGFAQETAGPAPYERLLLEDAAGDFAGRGELELVALHVSEKYRFDMDAVADLGPALYFRIEVPGIGTLQNPTTYHVFATTPEGAEEFWVEVVSDRGVPKVESSNVVGHVNATSVFVIVPYKAVGLAPGQELTGVFAASATMTGDQRVWQDVVPTDNVNLPAGLETPAPEEVASTVLEGPFPFVVAEPTTPLALASVDAEPVVFKFTVSAAAQNEGDLVRFYFEAPAGWRVDPSPGVGGSSPQGELVNVGAAAREFRIDVTPAGLTPRGETGVVRTTMASSSGGFQQFDLTVEITGPRIESPDYVFEQESFAWAGSPPDHEPTPIGVRVTKADGSALGPEATLSFDITLHDGTVDTVEATRAGERSWTTLYAFPEPGTYTVDAYLTHLRPSPHATFEVKSLSEQGGMAPGPGALAFVIALATALVLLRRR